MPYPTTEDLRRWLRREEELTTEETAQAELLLDLAAGAVEDECGQALELAPDTAVLDGTGTGRLILPRWPVTAVDTVTLLEDGDVLEEGPRADYTWSRSGVLHRKCGRWPCEAQAIEVDYTAGHDPIPKSVARIVLRLAADAWNNPLKVSAETLGDHSLTYASAAEANMEITEADRRILSKYRARE